MKATSFDQLSSSQLAEKALDALDVPNGFPGRDLAYARSQVYAQLATVRAIQEQTYEAELLRQRLVEFMNFPINIRNT